MRISNSWSKIMVLAAVISTTIALTTYAAVSAVLTTSGVSPESHQAINLALTKFLRQFYGSIHSASITRNGKIISVAIISPEGRKRTPATAFVLNYQENSWHKYSTVGLIDYIGPGEDHDGTVKYLELSSGVTSAAFTINFASAQAGLVVANMSDTEWKIIPFGSRGQMLIENPVFTSSQKVVSTGNTCTPSCVGGKEFRITYRYEAPIERFEQTSRSQS
ncbi:MAG TPA: hypothetical protein VIJ34_13845 [Acidimicrobiales bacterium]